MCVGGAEADSGSEGKSGEDYGKREFGLDPIEGGADVFDFADAVSVRAFTQSGAAEVEAQDGESEAVEGFHGVEDDFVVERSAKEWMRMADDGGVGCGRGSGVEQSFEASGGAGEGEGADAGSFGHGMSVVVGRSVDWPFVQTSIAENSHPGDWRAATGDWYSFAAWICLG